MKQKTKLASLLLLIFGALSQAQPETVAPASAHPAMLDPSKAVEQAPEQFLAKFSTTKGEFLVEVNREWSPNGADRFYNLVKINYFQDVVFFRAIEGFMCQFGIHGDPAVNAKWSEANIQDDPNKSGVSNVEGFVTFAKSGLPNSRSVQFFINLGDNARLDRDNFTPIAKVIKGMDVVKKLNTEYGENQQEDQGSFQSKGNAYIIGKYPNLDMIKSVSIVESGS